MAAEQFSSPQDNEIIPLSSVDVPTAPLLCLSLKKLQEWDTEESKSLFRASKELGFFYLDLGDSPEGSSILHQAEQLFQIGLTISLTDHDTLTLNKGTSQTRY